MNFAEGTIEHVLEKYRIQGKIPEEYFLDSIRNTFLKRYFLDSRIITHYWKIEKSERERAWVN